MADPQNNKPKPDNEIKVDPATLVAIIAVLILLPLLLTGFISQ